MKGTKFDHVEASQVVIDDKGNYINVHGKPFLLTGIQIRPDRVIEQYSVSNDEEFEKYVEPLFKHCSDMAFKTVIFPVYWRQIEQCKGEYSFSLLKHYYDCAKKYNLFVHLLWFGSDICGFSIDLPNYIREDTVIYSRLTEYSNVINYSDEDLIKRECKAFQKLLNWLYVNDFDQRTIAIQLENEPNHSAYNGPKLDQTDMNTYKKTSWCAGQKEAILNIVNKLGMIVKTGPYRCVTRVNLMTHTYLWNSSDRLKQEAEDVLAEGGVDIVGYDTYQTGTLTHSLDSVKDIKTNVAHWAEFGARGANYVPAILLALSRRAGVLGYQLKNTPKNPNGGIISFVDNIWTWPIGEKDKNSDRYRVDAYEIRAVNTVLNKANNKIALNDIEKTHVFNVERFTECSELVKIAGIEVKFDNYGAIGFGGCGYATMTSNDTMLVFATRGNTTFEFSGKNVISIETGFFIDEIWNTEKQLIIFHNSVSITGDMANAGTLIRITFE